MRKFNKKLVVGTICGVVMASSIGFGAKAYFTSEQTTQSSYKVVKVGTEIEEEVDTEGTKYVRVKNTETASCYIRARVTMSPSQIEKYVSLKGLNTADWILNSDGYYYYNKILKPGDVSFALFEGYEVADSDEAVNMLKSTEFSITIEHDAVQVLKDENENPIEPVNGKIDEAWKRYKGNE